MSTLAADIAFDFTYPPCDPATPPPPPAGAAYSYNPSLLDIPYHHYPHHGLPLVGHPAGQQHGHARSLSQCSAQSAQSAQSAYSYASTTPSDSFVSTPGMSTAPSTRTNTPARSPIRTHGPLLLPKIRSRDQALGGEDNSSSSSGAATAAAPAPFKRARMSPAPAAPNGRSQSLAAGNRRRRRSALVTPKPYSAAAAAAAASTAATASRHVRSFTNPDSLALFSGSRSFSADDQTTTTPPPPPPVSAFEATPPPPTLLCSPASFQQQQQQQPQQQPLQFFPESSESYQFHDMVFHNDSRRASTCSLDDGVDIKYDYDTYSFAPYPGTVPTAYFSSPHPTLGDAAGVLAASSAVAAVTADVHEETYLYHPQQYTPRAPSPLSIASTSANGTPEPASMPMSTPIATPMSLVAATATTSSPPAAVEALTGPTSTLLTYLTGPNPAPALVRTISFPLRDPNTKHYWWDVRQVRPWTAFAAPRLLALPGATAVLTCPVPQALLPAPTSSASLLPETEAALHTLCAAHYLPRVNAALSLSSPRPVQLSSSSSSAVSAPYGDIFVAQAAGDNSAPAAALFGGKPTARVVGLVKSYDRFNTGMRTEGNVKRVEYLRGLAHLHHLLREHSCRYGFILTEIELVVVRNGTGATPQFGQLEVASVPLAAAAAASARDSGSSGRYVDAESVPLTACLALWGLCMLASNEMAAAAVQAGASSSSSSSTTSTSDILLCPYHTHIGAPAEGTRRQAAPRDAWMPTPQLAEKRAAKRARGWVLPEDAVGRKEMGRRGVRYGTR
ncbi:sialidase-like protein [Niveomyces insectorum RCEF 264]|uniref:Sialidase-like protein n=1 Tax=Niveomyces insectorum RCEF 264 TaxID=1081102 RepID=A0A167QRV1_9HYPO|nr:sialidase-like protein [Niveomyces insectorum RCEF 264]